MKASARTFVVGLLISVALPSGIAIASDPSEQLLLERANYWRAQNRLDLASDILNKVLAHNPGQPDALYQQGMLALAQQNRGEAEQYFDRLRQLAPADPRAAELVGGAAQSKPPPAPAPVAQAAVTAAGVAIAAPNPPTNATRAAAAPPTRLELAAVTADGDDVSMAAPADRPRVPANPSPRVADAGPTLGEGPRARQVASLPQQTVSDGDTPIPPTGGAARAAGSTDLGITVQPVQVAQVELMPPPPVGGYQRPANATPYLPTDTLEMDIDRDLTQLEAQSNPSLVAGVGFRAHSGDDGLNRLNEVGVPIEASFSPWYTGTARLAILPVYLDANGSVSSSQLGQFGTNPLLSANGSSLVGSGGEGVTGVGILGGYALGDFSGQFGTSPLGFPVTNLVGMASYAPKFFDDTVTVRLQGLRQPVTDSVLSYAGTHASLGAANAIAPGAFGTNSIWGGVVKTGGNLTVFYDDQIYGAYGGAGLGSLTGRNVAENSEIDALLGAYFRPWKTDNWAIRVGVSVYYTGYDKNLSGFTFGQGGYFSPQNYEALTFPVEYTGHEGDWSWLASAALGVQHFHASTSPIFPNNAGAQMVLATLSPGSSTFPSTNSIGPAFNIKGQIEYAIDNTLTVGASASLDNGNNYTEGIGKIYLRKTFDWFAPVAAKSDPVSIVSRDQPMSRL